MTKTLSKATGLLTAAAFYSFFIFGFTDNLKGATLPPLLTEMGLNYSIGGTILFGAYVGFIIATLFTGILADTIGNKAVLLLAGALLIFGILGYSSFTSVIGLIAAMAVIGMGLGSIELGANSIIVDIHPLDKGRYLNLMAVFHGLGSMLAPLFAGWLLISGSSWRSVYRWDLALVGLMILFFLLSPYPHIPKSKTEKFDLSHLGKTAFARPMGQLARDLFAGYTSNFRWGFRGLFICFLWVGHAGTIPGKFHCGESGIFTFHFVCHHWGYGLHRIGNIRPGSPGLAFTSGWFFSIDCFPHPHRRSLGPPHRKHGVYSRSAVHLCRGGRHAGSLADRLGGRCAWTQPRIWN
jgi:MFS family permease